jgi:molybdopterin converting factor small subunit
MKLNVSYMAQAKKAVGAASELFELDRSCTISEFIVDHLCRKHDRLRDCLLDENNLIRKVVAIFVGDTKVDDGEFFELHDGDEITIMPPIAGG